MVSMCQMRTRFPAPNEGMENGTHRTMYWAVQLLQGAGGTTEAASSSYSLPHHWMYAIPVPLSCDSGPLLLSQIGCLEKFDRGIEALKHHDKSSPYNKISLLYVYLISNDTSY
jgi:hypothetical protein